MKTELASKVELIFSVIEELEVKYEELNKKNSILDKVKIDLEHEIELDKISASSMMKKYKELQGVLKLRRETKDEIEYILKLRESAICLGSVKSAKKKIDKLDKDFSNRKYNPRTDVNSRNSIKNEIIKYSI